MNNKMIWTVFFGSVFLAPFFLSGCVTAKSIDIYADAGGRSMLVVPFLYSFVQYDGEHELSMGLRSNTVIPAGKHILAIRDNKQYDIDAGDTYVQYTEIWSCEYEFLPGKSYKIETKNAPLSYSDRKLTTSAPGVTLSGSSNNVRVSHAANADIELIEYTFGPGGGMIGNTYVGPHFYIVSNFFMGWLYGPYITFGGGGPKLGLEMLGSKIGMGLFADAGVAASLSIPTDGFTAGLSFHYGGLAELYTPAIGFAAGGGVTNVSTFAVEGDDSEYSWPYLEIDILFGNLFSAREKRELSSSGPRLYFQYYFNDSKAATDKFGVGLKASF